MAYLGNILLVEDEDSVRYSLELALSNSGYNVTTASDGVKGLSWLMLTSKNTKSFDLLIMDVMMPVMNGISLLRKIRQYKISIPTLVITGCVDGETIRKLHEAGGVEILKKPFVPDLFLQKVNEIISTNSHSRNAAVAADEQMANSIENRSGE